MAASLWTQGFADAIGFLAGALAGFAVGRLLGFDFLAPGYDTASILGIALVGIGGGIGLQSARSWYRRRNEAVRRRGDTP